VKTGKNQNWKTTPEQQAVTSKYYEHQYQHIDLLYQKNCFSLYVVALCLSTTPKRLSQQL